MQSWEAVTDEHQQKRIASFTSISGPCLDHAGMWMRRRLRHPTPRNLLQYLGQMAKSWYMAMFQLPFIPELYWKLLGRFWPKFLKRTEGIRIGITDTQISDGKHGINLYRANILARLFFPRERRTTVPVQLIVPLKDPYASPVLFDELPYWVPNLTRHDVDAKHWLPLSHPEYLADRVMQFVGELQSGIRV
jgi:pimeloyl-ACP methyl ester carboxylesterase